MGDYTLDASTIRDFQILIDADNIIVDGEALPSFPQKYRGMVTSLEYDEKDDKDAKLTIKFDGINTREDGEFLLNLENKYLTVRWGYRDKLSPIYRVYVVDVTFEFTNTITATLVAYNGGINMDVVKRRIWQKINIPSDAPYTFVLVSDIVKKIADENGLKAVIDKTAPIKDKTIKQTTSDNDFLKELLEYAKPADGTNKRYTLNIENEVLYFTCENRYKAPEFIFTYRRDFKGVVLSFKPKSNEKKGKRQQATKAVAVDKDKKDTQKISYGTAGKTIDVDKIVDDAIVVKKENYSKDFANKVVNSKYKQYMGNKYIQTTDENGKTVLVAAVQMNAGKDYNIINDGVEEPKLTTGIIDSDLDKNKQDNKNEKEKFEEMEATLTLLGVPEIGRGIIIAVLNVFGTYEGNWFVSGVKHSLTATSYITTLDLKRNPNAQEAKNDKSDGNEKISYGTAGKTIDIDKITDGEIVNGDPNNKGKYIYPLDMRGASITSPWNKKRAKKGGGYYRHDGVDIAKVGTVPIIASAPGTVIVAGNVGGYGQTVFIKDDYGMYQTYAHLRTGLSVKQGQRVKQGQILGYMGNTGHSTGQHLHFEFRTSGVLSGSVENDINPIPFMPPRSK